jgi:hypothetical protein
MQSRVTVHAVIGQASGLDLAHVDRPCWQDFVSSLNG